MTQVKKTCGFYVKESSFSSTPPSHDLKREGLFDEYEETKKGKVRRKYINAMCCGKKIYTERGGDPLCEEHYSEEFARHLKNQRRLKRLYQNHDNQADRGVMFSGGIKAGAVLIASALIWFLIVGRQPPDKYYYSQIEKLETFKNKILLSQPVNHGHISKGLNIERDLKPLEIKHPSRRYRSLEDDYSSEGMKKRKSAYEAWQAFYDAKYLMTMDLVLTYLDDSTDDLVRERILWYLANDWGIGHTGFEYLYGETKKRYGSVKIKDNLHIALDEKMGSYVDIGTTMLFYEKYAKLNGYYYDLSDRDFLATELCRAVKEESLIYASALVDYSLPYFDPGLLRCISYGSTMIEFKGNTIGMKSDSDVISKLGVCPQSLRRISGANYGRAAESRAASFERNLKKLGTIDSSKVTSYSDAIDKITSKLAAASANTPKISEAAGSMNSLTDKYNKWAFCGRCSLESNVECR